MYMVAKALSILIYDVYADVYASYEYWLLEETIFVSLFYNRY